MVVMRGWQLSCNITMVKACMYVLFKQEVLSFFANTSGAPQLQKLFSFINVSFSCRGFCYFNSVAIAARLLRLKLSVERVLIVDWVSSVTFPFSQLHEFIEDTSLEDGRYSFAPSVSYFCTSSFFEMNASFRHIVSGYSVLCSFILTVLNETTFWKMNSQLILSMSIRER